MKMYLEMFEPSADAEKQTEMLGWSDTQYLKHFDKFAKWLMVPCIDFYRTAMSQGIPKDRLEGMLFNMLNFYLTASGDGKLLVAANFMEPPTNAFAVLFDIEEYGLQRTFEFKSPFKGSTLGVAKAVRNQMLAKTLTAVFAKAKDYVVQHSVYFNIDMFTVPVGDEQEAYDSYVPGLQTPVVYNTLLGELGNIIGCEKVSNLDVAKEVVQKVTNLFIENNGDACRPCFTLNSFGFQLREGAFLAATSPRYWKYKVLLKCLNTVLEDLCAVEKPSKPKLSIVQ